MFASLHVRHIGQPYIFNVNVIFHGVILAEPARSEQCCKEQPRTMISRQGHLHHGGPWRLPRPWIVPHFLCALSSNSSPGRSTGRLLLPLHSPFPVTRSQLTQHSQSLARSTGRQTSTANQETLPRLMLDLRNWVTLLTGQKIHL